MTFSEETAAPAEASPELPEHEFDMATADLVGDFLDEIARVLEAEYLRTGMTKSALARRMRRHKSVVTRMLKGGRSLNLATAARIVRALDHYPEINLKPLYSQFGDNQPTWHEAKGLVRPSVGSVETLSSYVHATNNVEKDATGSSVGTVVVDSGV